MKCAYCGRVYSYRKSHNCPGCGAPAKGAGAGAEYKPPTTFQPIDPGALNEARRSARRETLSPGAARPGGARQAVPVSKAQGVLLIVAGCVLGLVIIAFLIGRMVADYRLKNPDYQDLIQEDAAYQLENALEYPLAQSGEVDGFSIKLLGLSESLGNRYSNPERDTIYLYCLFEVQNGSDEADYVSYRDLKIYVDGYPVSYSSDAGYAMDYSASFYGMLGPGKRLKGYLPLAAPASWRELEIEFGAFKYDSNEAATFTVERPEGAEAAITALRAEMQQAESESASASAGAGDTQSDNAA